jgi:hypothetical protein
MNARPDSAFFNWKGGHGMPCPCEGRSPGHQQGG